MNQPVYISIDKDVFDENEVNTTWDQGTMTMCQLEDMLHYLFGHQLISGVDICGETDLYHRNYVHKNDLVNEEFITFLQTE